MSILFWIRVIIERYVMKPMLLVLILSTMFMFDLSASKTDNDVIVKDTNKNEFTFTNWKNLHKLNSETLHSMEHRAWFDIYVNTLAQKPYVEKMSLFPVGSLVLKPLYPDEKRSETSKLTIMVKMEKGYDSENGDWWYGVYDKTGRKGSHKGKVPSCIKCHVKAKETDYMFSKSVMEDIEEEW